VASFDADKKDAHRARSHALDFEELEMMLVDRAAVQEEDAAAREDAGPY
jgi:uncharacterized DUF497 family protein